MPKNLIEFLGPRNVSSEVSHSRCTTVEISSTICRGPHIIKSSTYTTTIAWVMPLLSFTVHHDVMALP